MVGTPGEADRLARLLYDVLADKKGESLFILDWEGRTTIADRMLVATGQAPRHLEAMADAVEEAGRDEGIHVTREGTGQTGWILLDVGGVLVHLFSYAKRAHYRIEEMGKE